MLDVNILSPLSNQINGKAAFHLKLKMYSCLKCQETAVMEKKLVFSTESEHFVCCLCDPCVLRFSHLL